MYIGINDTKSHLLRHYTRYYAKCFTHISHLIHLTILQGIIIIIPGVDRILRQIPKSLTPWYTYLLSGIRPNTNPGTLLL